MSTSFVICEGKIPFLRYKNEEKQRLFEKRLMFFNEVMVGKRFNDGRVSLAEYLAYYIKIVDGKEDVVVKKCSKTGGFYIFWKGCIDDKSHVLINKMLNYKSEKRLK